MKRQYHYSARTTQDKLYGLDSGSSDGVVYSAWKPHPKDPSCARYIAEECAVHHHENKYGAFGDDEEWDEWFKVWDFEGKEIGIFQIELSFKPVFNVNQINIMEGKGNVR